MVQLSGCLQKPHHGPRRCPIPIPGSVRRGPARERLPLLLLAVASLMLTPPVPAPAQTPSGADRAAGPDTPLPGLDRDAYLTPDEVRPGMTGFGRTVMSGTAIQTFEFEVISVMKNAWYARHAVILARCSGLNLEHTGLIGGMSGSPCYVRTADGTEKLIGAVAFGWALAKDPICGLQPITEMLPIGKVRGPGDPAETLAVARPTAPKHQEGPSATGGIPLGRLAGQAGGHPVPNASRFSLFNDAILAARSQRSARQANSNDVPGLRPLTTPMMVAGVRPEGIAWLREHLEGWNVEFLASGSASDTQIADAADVRLEPGSALSVQVVTGDLAVEAMGTCTTVIGDTVYGFGHELFAQGSVELPMATGMIHMVIPSVMRSNKMGSSLQAVGTLWGDETTGIFGTVGKVPPMTDLEVQVTDVRGPRTYTYQVARHRMLSPLMITMAAMESIFAHNQLPDEHHLEYDVTIDFGNVGTFTSSNLASQEGVMSLQGDVMFPIMTMMNNPFRELQVNRARVDVKIAEGVRQAQIEQARMPITRYKPGDTVTVQIRWFRPRQEPRWVEADYRMTLPDDLPDGQYQLSVGSVSQHLNLLQAEQPQRFHVRKLGDALSAMNLISSLRSDRLYMHLTLPTGGVAVGRRELPELPTFRQKIIADSGRADVQPYFDSVVVTHDTDFVVTGGQQFTIQVSRDDRY